MSKHKHGSIRDDFSIEEIIGSESNRLSVDCREFIQDGCRWNNETLCDGARKDGNT